MVKFELGYRADFSEYSSRRGGIDYEIYFTLTTKDGIQYITAYNPVASFSFSNNGGSSSSGAEILRPIFK